MTEEQGQGVPQIAPQDISKMVLGAFYQNAAEHPERCAVVDREGHRFTSYRDFAGMVNAIGFTLKKNGVGVGDTVALVLGKTMEHFAARIACLCIGAAFASVPVDLPEERRAFMLRDCDPAFVLDEAALAALPSKPCPPCFDPDVSLESPGYIAYTSGTTGDPKGILHNRSIMCVQLEFLRVFAETMKEMGLPQGFVAMHAALAETTFAVSLLDVAFLFAGQTVHLLEGDMVRDIALLRSYFIDNHIVSTFGIASLIAALGPLPELRVAVIAGEANNQDFSRFEHTVIYDVYGCSEAPVIAYGPLVGAGRQGFSVLGMHLPGSQVKLMPAGQENEPFDDGDGERPEGASDGSAQAAGFIASGEGEICYSGPGMMMRYLHEDQRESPFFADAETGRPFLHTNDWAQEGEHGIHVVGRLDDTCKIRGNRVNTAEVASALAHLEGVFESEVLAFGPTGAPALYAFYATAGGPAIDERLLRARLASKLPEYMIPASFMHLPALPRNRHGKVDRRALEKLVGQGAQDVPTAPAMGSEEPGDRHLSNDGELASSAQQPFDAQVTRCSAQGEQGESDSSTAAHADEDVRKVREAFCDVLGMPSVGEAQGFVALGGDSLSAMKLQAELADQWGVTVPANELLELSTPRAIAKVLRERQGSGDVDLSIDDFSLERGVPLSESQLNVYLGSQTREVNTVYNNPIQTEVPVRVGKQAILDAFEYLVKKHPIFRARVLAGADGPFLAFGMKPEIRFGTQKDVESFVKPFAFDGPLTRALAVESPDGFMLYADIHHIIADGTSLNLIGNELLHAIYGLVPEDEMRNPEPDLGFLRQLAWERSFRESDAFERAHQVFDGMLQDAEDVCELLPSPEGRDSWQTYMLKVRFEEVSRFCRACEVTPSQLLTAVFAYTLSRFTGDNRALFCLISDGRGSHDLKGSVGMYTKTLPVLVDCSNRDVASFLHECARISNGAMLSDGYPFRLLAGEYSVTSSIQFQYSHDLGHVLEVEKRNAALFLLRHDNVADLEFNVGKRADGFICRVHHSAKYSDGLCDRIVECFDEVLRGMMGCVELKDIAFTSAIDLGFMDRVNETDQILRFTDVMDAFEARLHEQPEARLVSDRDGVLSYAQGAARIRAAADELLACSVHAGDAVLCLPERSRWCMLGAFAVVALGAAYVPVEEALPDERVRFMLEDSRAKAVLVTRATYGRAKQLVEGLDLPEDVRPHVVCVSDIEDGLFAGASADSLGAVRVDPQDAAVILYTSGTTGKPKGVVVPRLALANLAQSFVERTDMAQDDVFGLWTAYSFDMHTLALFPVVLAGASCDVVPAEARLDLDKLDARYRASGATMTCLTTHVGKLFVGAGLGGSLRQVLVIGETLGEFTSPETPQMWESYGPTESIALVTTIPVNERSHTSSVGKLNCNVRSYVLDAEGRRVPLGAVGDLYLSGNQLAKGYLGRPEATAEAFVRNPFAFGRAEYARMYRTGDTARYLPDGTIGFVGRKDSQVKIRGNRIELAEVEALVAAIDFVAQAAVLAVADGDSKRLVAYVVLAPGASFENDARLTDEIARQVMEKAPAYMAPGFVVPVDSIPQNANGKVDKRKLPVPNFNAYSEYRAPEDAVEAAICTAFERALGVGRVGADDEFQRLGGDSIGAIKVVHELSRLGLECSAVAVLERRTPRALADELREHGIDGGAGEGFGAAQDNAVSDDADERALFEFDAESRAFACPLTDTQENFVKKDDPRNGTSVFVFADMVPCPEGVTVEQAQQTVEHAIERHPVLSAKVERRDGRSWFVGGGDPEVRTVDASAMDPQAVWSDFTAPFDFEQRLSRFWIVLSPQGLAVLHACHHSISDAASVAALGDELRALMQGEQLDGIDLGFLKLASNAEHARGTKAYAQARTFFEDAIGRMGFASSVPASDNTGANRPGTAFITLPGCAARVDEYAREQGLTRGMLFHAAWSCVLSRLCAASQKDGAEPGAVMYKTGLHGRYEDGFDAALGCFADFTVVVNEHAASLQESCGNIRSVMLGTIERSVYPYKLLKDAHPDITHLMFFEYVPLVDSHEPGSVASAQRRGRDLVVEHVPARDDSQVMGSLIAAVYDTEDGFVFTAEHSSKYSEKKIENMALDFFDALLELVG